MIRARQLGHSVVRGTGPQPIGCETMMDWDTPPTWYPGWAEDNKTYKIVSPPFKLYYPDSLNNMKWHFNVKSIKFVNLIKFSFILADPSKLNAQVLQFMMIKIRSDSDQSLIV